MRMTLLLSRAGINICVVVVVAVVVVDEEIPRNVQVCPESRLSTYWMSGDFGDEFLTSCLVCTPQ